MSSLAERFWPKVDVRGPNECWPWTGGLGSHGYGAIGAGGKYGAMLLAHRVAYELCIGPIPPGLQIDHVRTRGCVRPDCVNPAHLEAVTNATNSRRSRKAKITAEIAEEVRRERRAGVRVIDIAARHGISSPAVSNIVAGRRWGV